MYWPAHILAVWYVFAICEKIFEFLRAFPNTNEDLENSCDGLTLKCNGFHNNNVGFIKNIL